MWKRFAVVASLIGMVVLAFICKGQLLWNENVADILPNSAEFKDYAELMRVFRPDNRAFFLLKKGQPTVSEEVLMSAADEFAVGLERAQHKNIKLFSQVLYQQDVDPMAYVDFYLQRQGLYFAAAQAHAASNRLTGPWLSDRFAGIRRQLLESPAPGLLKIICRDPLDISAGQWQTLQTLLPTQEKITLHNGRLFSEDLQAILIIAAPAGESTDIGQAQHIVNLVSQLQTNLAQKHPDIHLLWLAGQRFSMENATTIRQDVSLIFLVSTLLILLMIWITLRQMGSVIILILPWIFGFSLAFALVSVTHSAVSVIALGMASILAGITMDYGVYVLCFGRELGDAQKAARQLAHPQFLAVATSIIAFAALIFSGITVLQQLGELASYWLAGSSFFALVCLPTLLSWFKLLKPPATNLDIGLVQRKILHLPNKTRFWLLVLISLLLLPGLSQLKVEDDLQNFNHVSPATRADYTEIGELVDINKKTMYAVVSSTDLQQALQKNKQLAEELGKLKKQGSLMQFSTIADLLPPQALQAENYARWSQFWHPARIQTLSTTLEQAATSAGMRFQMFTPYLTNLGSEPALWISEKTLPPSLAQIVAEHVKRVGKEIYILTRIEPVEHLDVQGLSAHLRSLIPGLRIADMGLLRHSTMKLFTNGLLTLTVFVIGLILVFLLIFIRDSKRTIAVLTPLIIAFFWTFGLLGWLHVKIDASSSIVSVILFGVMVDYSIYITDSMKKRASLGALPTAITISILSTLLGFGSLILAQHPVMHACGIATLATTVCGWLAVSLSSFIYKPVKKK